jgi:subfamily B ATP-binding cassette protein MsbA
VLNSHSVATARRLLALAAGERWIMPCLILLAVVAFLFEAAAIFLLLPLVRTLMAPSSAPPDNAGLLEQAFEKLLITLDAPTLVSAIILCILMKSVTSLASQTAFAAASARTTDRLRRRIFERILMAPQDYHDGRRAGVLLNTLTSETWRLSDALQAVANLFTHLGAIVVFGTTMALLSWKLTLITSAFVAIILLIVGALTSRAKLLGEAAVSANQELAARMTEGLGGLRTIRLHGQESAEAERFSRASVTVRKAFFRMNALSAVPPPLLEFMFALVLGILLLTSSTGEFALLLVFVGLLQRLQPHAAALVHARNTLLSLSGSMDDVLTVLRDPAAEPLLDGTQLAPAPQRVITFQSVDYQYPGRASAALKGASFAVPAHRTTALVGKSGAGKSTVVSLLCRLTDPQSGAIMIDGHDLRDVKLASWRARIAVVPQDPYLFNASVRENIAYGVSSVSAEDVINASKAAHAHPFISGLPNGYDESAGDQGSRFSSGQRQRIALARALIRSPDILILDEATNALDAHSEMLVHDAIEQLRGTCTIIIIAHRMATLERADHIIVLEEGRVVESGAAASLRASGGVYAQLRQMERLPT